MVDTTYIYIYFYIIQREILCYLVSVGLRLSIQEGLSCQVFYDFRGYIKRVLVYPQ